MGQPTFTCYLTILPSQQNFEYCANNFLAPDDSVDRRLDRLRAARYAYVYLFTRHTTVILCPNCHPESFAPI